MGVTVVAVIVIALLVAVAGLAHGSLEVMITVTISPSARVVVVNVAAVSPGTLHYLSAIVSWRSTTINRCGSKGYRATCTDRSSR